MIVLGRFDEVFIGWRFERSKFSSQVGTKVPETQGVYLFWHLNGMMALSGNDQFINFLRIARSLLMTSRWLYIFHFEAFDIRVAA
jgi:hypothetical protein